MTGSQVYFHKAFGDAEILVREAAHHLRGVDCDTLVGTGLSGALVVPLLGRAFGKRFAIVRKANDGAHSSQQVEGDVGWRWVFVDDFVASGATRRRVQSVMRHWFPAATYVGTYEYEVGS